MTLTDLPTLAGSGIQVSLLKVTDIHDLATEARRFLVTEEREQLAAIANPMRRREWLAVRICAKLMAMRNGLIASSQDCRVSKSDSGRPYLRTRDGSSIPGIGDCSLSHKGPFACVCLSSPASVRVGVDIEKVSPRLHGLRDAFLNSQDIAGLGGSAEADLAVLWTLKEAYSKVTGTGIGIGLQNLICDNKAETNELGVRSISGARASARHVIYKGHAIGVCFAHQSLLPSVKNSPQTRIEKGAIDEQAAE